jgi:hypothetical protein
MFASLDKLADEKKRGACRAEARRRRLGEGGIFHRAEKRLHRKVTLAASFVRLFKALGRKGAPMDLS